MQDAHDSREAVEDRLASWIARRFPGCTLDDIAWDTALVVAAVTDLGLAAASQRAADALDAAADDIPCSGSEVEAKQYLRDFAATLRAIVAEASA